MKTKIVLSILSLPLIATFVLLTPAIVLFTFPSLMGLGNPLNLLFIAWWLIGGFGIHSVFKAIFSNTEKCELATKYQIGMLAGAVAYIPVPLFGGFHWGIKIIMFIGILPVLRILIAVRKKPKSGKRE